MFKSLFFRRLYIPYLLVICAVALIIGFLGALRLHDSHLSQARHLLRSTVTVVAQLLERDLESGDQAELEKQVSDLGKRLGQRITVIGPDDVGTVLADSQAQTQTMGPHRYRPEVIMAFTSGEGWDVRTSDTLHQELLYYAQRVIVHGKPAYIRLAIPVNDLNQSMRVFYVSIVVATVLCIIFATVVSYYLARHQALAIVQVTGFADAVAKGNLDHRILRTDRGELGILARSLNSMADSLTRLIAEAERGKAELRTILTSMSEGVIATDAHRRILMVNEAAARLLDFNAAQAKGKLVWEVIRLEQVIKAIDEVAVDDQRKLVQVDQPGGRHLEVTIGPFNATATTKAGGLLVVIHDVTQAMRYQDLRKEFVANVSHELRTPLTVIKGYVETLRDGAINDAKKRDEYLATIERHSNQLSNLVSDLLEISKLESQTALPRRASVDIAALIRRVGEYLQPAASFKNHTLEIELPAAGTIPPVLGNADYLERAVVNLVDNAIKYTPSNSNGKVTVSVRSDAAHVYIDVRDTGIGIPQEDIARIFERFYRVDRSRSREMGGTGLGLAIVKHIAQVHGGSVSVESELNHGSHFTITLPAATSV